MKIDHDYLKGLLEAFQSSDEPTTDIEALEAAGYPYATKEFVFHMGILLDQSLVERDDGDSGFGLIKGIDGYMSWSVLPLRMTAAGHDFLQAIENKEVWAVLKKNFKEDSIGTLVSVSKKLFDAYTKKKIDELLGNT